MAGPNSLLTVRFRKRPGIADGEGLNLAFRV